MNNSSFARGYVAGRMDGLNHTDEMRPLYAKWQTVTNYKDGVTVLAGLEALARSRGMLQLEASFRAIRVEKESWRKDHPSCPVCDSTLAWPINDLCAEIGYCFTCRREWPKTALATVTG